MVLRDSPVRALTAVSLKIVFIALEPPARTSSVPNYLVKCESVQLLCEIMDKLRKHVLPTDDTPTFRRIGQSTIDAGDLVKWLEKHSAVPSDRVVCITKELKNH